jgi:hypothetical protein
VELARISHGPEKVVRDVTNEQRHRRTLFKPILWGGGQLADFLRCSLLTYRFRFARRSRLENCQLTDGGMPPTYDSMHKSELSVENWILRYAIHRLYHFRLLVDAEWIRSQL